MPQNHDDVAAAVRVVELGYPNVEPVLPDMVLWMRVAESPVADKFAEFFADLGDPAVDAIFDGLRKENIWLRHRILTEILPRWSPESIERLKNILTVVATDADAYNNDVLAVSILAKYSLAPLDWLRGWLTFKEERQAERTAMLKRVAEELEDV